MNTTTCFKTRSLSTELGFEIKYYHDDDIYQVIIMEYKDNSWKQLESIEIDKNEVVGLFRFLELTFKISNS